MYAGWLANTAVVTATAVVVILCVLLHYEGLVIASRRLAAPRGHRRVKVLYGIGIVLALHVAEIWIFGLAYLLLLLWPECGLLAGQHGAHPLDRIYFSAATYTTVGYGDLAPVGPIRFLAGTESLVGFVMITWSASFTYLEMAKFWRSS